VTGSFGSVLGRSCEDGFEQRPVPRACWLPSPFLPEFRGKPFRDIGRLLKRDDGSPERAFNRIVIARFSQRAVSIDGRHGMHSQQFFRDVLRKAGRDIPDNSAPSLFSPYAPFLMIGSRSVLARRETTAATSRNGTT
jgi:hypothetical protein